MEDPAFEASATAAGVDLDSFPLLRPDQIGSLATRWLQAAQTELEPLLHGLRAEAAGGGPGGSLLHYAEQQYAAVGAELSRRDAASRLASMLTLLPAVAAPVEGPAVIGGLPTVQQPPPPTPLAATAAATVIANGRRAGQAVGSAAVAPSLGPSPASHGAGGARSGPATSSAPSHGRVPPAWLRPGPPSVDTAPGPADLRTAPAGSGLPPKPAGSRADAVAIAASWNTGAGGGSRRGSSRGSGSMQSRTSASSGDDDKPPGAAARSLASLPASGGVPPLQRSASERFATRSAAGESHEVPSAPITQRSPRPGAPSAAPVLREYVVSAADADPSGVSKGRKKRTWEKGDDDKKKARQAERAAAAAAAAAEEAKRARRAALLEQHHAKLSASAGVTPKVASSHHSTTTSVPSAASSPTASASPPSSRRASSLSAHSSGAESVTAAPVVAFPTAAATAPVPSRHRSIETVDAVPPPAPNTAAAAAEEAVSMCDAPAPADATVVPPVQAVIGSSVDGGADGVHAPPQASSSSVALPNPAPPPSSAGESHRADSRDSEPESAHAVSSPDAVAGGDTDVPTISAWTSSRRPSTDGGDGAGRAAGAFAPTPELVDHDSKHEAAGNVAPAASTTALDELRTEQRAGDASVTTWSALTSRAADRSNPASGNASTLVADDRAPSPANVAAAVGALTAAPRDPLEALGDRLQGWIATTASWQPSGPAAIDSVLDTVAASDSHHAPTTSTERTRHDGPVPSPAPPREVAAAPLPPPAPPPPPPPPPHLVARYPDYRSWFTACLASSTTPAFALGGMAAAAARARLDTGGVLPLHAAAGHVLRAMAPFAHALHGGAAGAVTDASESAAAVAPSDSVDEATAAGGGGGAAADDDDDVATAASSGDDGKPGGGMVDSGWKDVGSVEAVGEDGAPLPGACFIRIATTRKEVTAIVRRALLSLNGAGDAWSEVPARFAHVPVWNVMWSWGKPPINRNMLLSWQKVNHFRHARELTRKDLLKKNLSRYQCLSPRMAAAFQLQTPTFVLPKEYLQFAEAYGRIASVSMPMVDFLATASLSALAPGAPAGMAADSMARLVAAMGKPAAAATTAGSGTAGDPNIWILKPAGLSRGRGISLVANIAEVQYAENSIIQKYIHNPLLLDGYKFDLRLYVLVTSFAPLEAFLYRRGYARLSSRPFTADVAHIADKFVHLTNSSVQKHSATAKSAMAALPGADATLVGGTKCR